jgi:hypothetical protein
LGDLPLPSFPDTWVGTVDVGLSPSSSGAPLLVLWRLIEIGFDFFFSGFRFVSLYPLPVRCVHTNGYAAHLLL